MGLYQQTSQKQTASFNPYGKKYNPTRPSQTLTPPPKQIKLKQHHPQLEEMNNLPESESLKIGFININGLYPAKEDRMLEVLQYMYQQKIDIFGLAKTNLLWNKWEI